MKRKARLLALFAFAACAAPTLPVATVCKNGGIVGDVTCADQTLTCKGKSASDPTGSLDSDGALVCE